MNQEFEILITRKTMVSSKVKIKAKTYFDAVEKLMKKARLGEIQWSKENIIIQHDCEDTNPEAPPVL